MASKSSSSSHSTAVVMGVAAAALLFGGGNTFTTKVLITAMPCDASCAAGSSTTLGVSFNKPIFSTLIAFGGMAAGLFYYAARWAAGRYKRQYHKLGSLGDGGTYSVDTAATLLDSSSSGYANDDDDGRGRAVKLEKVGSGSGVAATSLSSGSTFPALAGTVVARYRPLAVPACLDVTATALQAAASLFIPAAVNAVIRGTILLFTAAANRVFGVRDGAANRREWAAIGFSMIGVCLVGLSSVLNSNVNNKSSDSGSSISGGSSGSGPSLGMSPAAAAVLGVFLALLSNVVQGVQVAYETRFLEGAVYSPVEANAAEGVIGVVLCGVILVVAQALPFGPDNGHIEDSAQTACCLARTPSIAGVSLLLWALFGLSTVAHMALSLLRGSNFRSFILCGRSLLIWGMEFAAFYASGGASNTNSSSSSGPQLGSGWQPYSWLEALGFGVLVAGGVAQYVEQNRRESSSAAAGQCQDDDEAGHQIDLQALQPRVEGPASGPTEGEG